MITDANGWIPIADAPRDGTVVDIWFESPHGSLRVADCQFHNGEWCALIRDCLDPAGVYVGSVATHFRPLPLPPEVTQ